jgi:hypothetical protein
MSSVPSYRHAIRLVAPTPPPQPTALARARGRDKPHYSRWLITVNPNIPMRPFNSTAFEDWQQRFLRWMECVFPAPTGNYQQLGEVMMVAPRGLRAGDVDSDIPALVTDLNMQVGVDVGDKQHRIHMHALFEVEHWSWIQLNYKRIREILQRCDREDPFQARRKGAKRGIHVDFKYVGSSRPISNYVNKGLDGRFETAERPTAIDWKQLESMPAKPDPNRPGQYALSEHDWVMSGRGPVHKPGRRKK